MQIKQISTERFARLILSRPNIIHSFILDGLWYDIVCARILEPQSVLISPSIPSDIKPVVFNLTHYIPDEFCEDIGAEQSPQCVNEMVSGLSEFNTQDSWFVKPTDLARLNIQYKNLN